MADSINLNTARANELTQLPGVGIDLAYKIVTYRAQHGAFTTWDEVAAIDQFPADRLEEIKARAVLGRPFEAEDFVPPHHRRDPETEPPKKPVGYSSEMRSTRG